MPPVSRNNSIRCRRRIRDRHVSARVPERFADAVVGVVVQDDEVADVLVFRGRGAIELLAPLLAIAAVRKQQDQALDRHLDQVNRCGLERLQKAAASPMHTTFRFHNCLRRPGGEANQPRLGERRCIEIRRPTARVRAHRSYARKNRRGRCQCGVAAGCATASLLRARSIACEARAELVRSDGSAHARSQGSQCDQSS